MWQMFVSLSNMELTLAQLDEAHNIKERSTNTAKATFELKGKYKWCLSGTPLQNRVGELYSLVRFLGGDPFSYYFCKRCDCKSLHWKFSDHRTCDGECPVSVMLLAVSPGIHSRLRSQPYAPYLLLEQRDSYSYPEKRYDWARLDRIQEASCSPRSHDAASHKGNAFDVFLLQPF